MNIKLLSSIIIVSLLTSHKAKAQDYQLPYSNSDIISTNAIFAQSVFSQGVKTFLQDIFSAPAYAQDFLPNNFFHMAELLEHGNQTGKDAEYVKSVIRLFTNKMKAASYINAYVFSDLLGQMPSLLQQHFVIDTTNAINSLKDIVYEMQYHSFMTQFPEFKSNPQSFLTNLSQQIETAADLRKLMTVFLEVSLNKLIWSPEDQFDTWQSTKLIADQLTSLYKRTIVSDVDDLNSLCITLLERYCLFLDIAGAYLEVATFEKIKQDIAVCRTPLLDLAEQEEYLESKMQRFADVLSKCEAKARARAQGFIIKND